DVDLDQAPAVALVPVVAAPRFVGHELEGEALALGELDPFGGPAPGLGDRGPEDSVDPLSGDDEIATEPFEPVDQRALAGEPCLEAVEDFPETAFGVGRRDGIVEGAG